MLFSQPVSSPEYLCNSSASRRRLGPSVAIPGRACTRIGCKSVSVKSSKSPTVNGLTAGAAPAIVAEGTPRTGPEAAGEPAAGWAGRWFPVAGRDDAFGVGRAGFDAAADGDAVAAAGVAAGTLSLLPHGQATILPAAESGMFNRVPQEGHFTFIA